MRTELRLSGLLVTLALGCAWEASDGSADDERDNQAPYPALRVPVVAPVGAPVSLNAEASVDPDGDLLSYVFEITGVDSIHTSESVVEYTFAARGLYTVRVNVIDSVGAQSVATQDITVQERYPEPPDFCAAVEDCAVGDECSDGVCYATGGAVEF